MNWVNELEPGLWKFINKMQEDDFSFFRYSKTGDIYKKDYNWGLANCVFAVRILYITGLIENLTEIQRENIYNGIIRNTKTQGYIYDTLITKLSMAERLRWYYGLVKNRNSFNTIEMELKKTRRAETRQSFAALHCLNKKPVSPFKDIPNSKSQIENYLNDLDWTKPWSAGSHFNHLLFFLRWNAKFFNNDIIKSNKRLISHAVDWINKIQNQKNGCWYMDNNIPLFQKINGAMKILNGFYVAGIEDIKNAKGLIDTGLSAINDEDACSNFNLIYVLYSANKIEKDYRFDEIHKFFMDRLNVYKKFYWSEHGGFSFFQRSANDTFYGKKITYGLEEPDIHGTAMFVWGISVIDKILDLDLGWTIPLN